MKKLPLMNAFFLFFYSRLPRGFVFAVAGKPGKKIGEKKSEKSVLAVERRAAKWLASL